MAKRTKPVGIKDVAKLANVSISTVSNVLNGSKMVSAGLQERVMQAVDELNYEVNLVARGLKSGKTNTVAVIVPSITSVFFPPLLKSIQDAADHESYSINVFGTSGSLEKEKKYIQTLKSQWVDGILLSSCIDTSDSNSGAYIEYLSALNTNGTPIPLICLESAISSSLDAVIVDDMNGLKTATEHLISLGRRSIAYIAAPSAFSMGKSRRDGYLTALAVHQIPINDQLMIDGDYTPASGYQCMKALLKRGLSIDAVAAGNDQMAIGAMRAILDAGLEIPGDIAVTGYNDNFPASLVQPSLSTIHVPKEDMGKTAFELFLRRLNNPEASHIHLCLNGSLVIRNSTAPEAKTQWNLQNW